MVYDCHLFRLDVLAEFDGERTVILTLTVSIMA
jgi:hypothetical protein